MSDLVHDHDGQDHGAVEHDWEADAMAVNTPPEPDYAAIAEAIRVLQVPEGSLIVIPGLDEWEGKDRGYLVDQIERGIGHGRACIIFPSADKLPEVFGPEDLKSAMVELVDARINAAAETLADAIVERAEPRLMNKLDEQARRLVFERAREAGIE